MTYRIPVAKPHLAGNERKYLNECVDRMQFSMGATVARLEAYAADMLDTAYVLTCSTGTAALHLALKAVGIGPGDDVIVPALTYVATANAVEYCGAKVVLADVDPETWCLDLADVENRVTVRTRATMPVHLYGNVCDVEPLRKFGFVIEDAAEAFGSRRDGLAAGTLGDIGCFSLFANKTIQCGEGGFLATQDSLLAERMMKLRGQGQCARRYWHDEVGYNYRMTELAAAVALAQLEGFDAIRSARKRIRRWYEQGLPRSCRMQSIDECVDVCTWMVAVTIDGATQQARDKIAGDLDRAGIETRPVFHPMHWMGVHGTRGTADAYPTASRIAESGIVLPTYVDLSDSDVSEVCDRLSEAIARHT